jgi:hypothetical protein
VETEVGVTRCVPLVPTECHAGHWDPSQHPAIGPAARGRDLAPGEHQLL